MPGISHEKPREGLGYEGLQNEELNLYNKETSILDASGIL